MKVAIYVSPDHPVGPALAQGLALAGHEVVHRSPTYYRGEVENVDLVVVKGMRDGAAVVAGYASVPALVVDWGYLKRVNSPEEAADGYWQVGAGGLNRIPDADCPSDRFDALGLEVVEQGGDPNGYVLVCGQVPGDAALGQDSSTHRQWLREQLKAYDDAVYRPHPRGGIAVPGLVGNTRPLADALAGARLVVTYNSNVGHDALLAGVPVVAHGPAAYAELSGETLPSLGARKAYFNRVAYGQWTLSEMASGEAIEVWQNGPKAEAVRETAEDRHDNASTDDQEGGQGLDPVATDHSKLKAQELRALLAERGVAVPAGTNKAGLLALLEAA